MCCKEHSFCAALFLKFIGLCERKLRTPFAIKIFKKSKDYVFEICKPNLYETEVSAVVSDPAKRKILFISKIHK